MPGWQRGLGSLAATGGKLAGPENTHWPPPLASAPSVRNGPPHLSWPLLPAPLPTLQPRRVRMEQIPRVCSVHLPLISQMGILRPGDLLQIPEKVNKGASSVHPRGCSQAPRHSGLPRIPDSVRNRCSAGRERFLPATPSSLRSCSFPAATLRPVLPPEGHGGWEQDFSGREEGVSSRVARESHLSLTCKGPAPQQDCPEGQMDSSGLGSTSDVSVASGKGKGLGLLRGAFEPPWGGKAGPGLGKGT